MYLKIKTKDGRKYYQAYQSINGKGVLVEHLGSIEQMVKHKRMATGKTMLRGEDDG